MDKWNSSRLPFGTRRNHSPAHTRPARRERENFATAASSQPARRTQASSHSPTDEVAAPSAKTARVSTEERGKAAGTLPSSDTTEEEPGLPEWYAPLALQRPSKQSLKQTFEQKVGVVRPLAEQARPAPKYDRTRTANAPP